MSVERRRAGLAAIGAFAYGLLAGFAVGMFPTQLGLGGAFFPVVLMLPIVIVAVLRRCSIKMVASLASTGLLGVYAGYVPTLLLRTPSPYRPFAALSLAGLATYDIPALAVVTTIVVVAANVSFAGKSRREPAQFSIPAAWLTLVVLVLLGAAYAFGSGTRSCGGAGWGYLYVLYVPLVFVIRPVLIAVPALAFVGGGFLPRYISLDRKAVITLTLLCMLAAGVGGFLASTPAAQPCSPL